MAEITDSDESMSVDDSETEIIEQNESENAMETAILNPENFTVRPYQLELLDRVLERNSIVCMGTGTGKTYVAVLVIKEYLHQTSKSLDNGGKRTFFLTNQVALADQQFQVLKRHFGDIVGKYVGADGVDEWHKHPTKWSEEFQKYRIIVMTAQILLDILHHGILRFNQINVLVLDECHHASGNHQYALIMEAGMTACGREDMPRILGLTASIVNRSQKKQPCVETSIKNIEKHLRSTAVTSCDIESMSKYGTKPDEDLRKCEDISHEPSSDLFKRMEGILNDGFCFLRLCEKAYDKDPVIQMEVEDIEPGCFEIKRKRIGLICCQHALESCSFLLYQLGPWASAHAAQIYIPQLEKGMKNPRLRLQEEKSLLNLGIAILQQLYRVFEKYFTENVRDIDDFLKLVSSKVRALNEIFKSCKEDSITGIVFVERRNSAYILHKLLEHLCGLDEDLSFVKSTYMVGGGSKGESLRSKEFELNQRENLKKFRMGDVNMLIATSVVREGIDVPKCNLVILFDVPELYTHYIQSKGRARAAKSKFIVLTMAEEFEKSSKKMEELRRLEKVIAEKCIKREEISEDVQDCGKVDALMPPYLPPVPEGRNQPMVTMTSAINLVNQYCMSLPRDRFTCLIPKVKLQEIEDEVGNTAFVCYLNLPNSRLKETIKSIPMSRKKYAQMAAALVACKRLHKLGELNDYLLPSVGEQHLFKNETAWKPERRVYEPRPPSCFSHGCIVENHTCHLYLIKSDVTDPPVITSNGKKCFGILSKTIIPRIPPIPLFSKRGTTSVSFEKISSSLELNCNEIKQVSSFHEFLFKKVLDLKLDCKFDPSMSNMPLTIVPLIFENNWPRIDWKCICSSLQNMNDELCVPCSSELAYKAFQDGVVCRRFEIINESGANHVEWFHVEEVCTDRTPLACMKDTLKTFKDYFEEKYAQKVENLDQPLLKVKQISRNLDFHTPKYSSSKGPVDRDLYLIPELCKLHVFPGSLWLMAVSLPTIFHRLYQLIVAEQIRELVAKQTGIGMEVLPHGETYPRLDFGIDAIVKKEYKKLESDSAKKREIEEIEETDLFAVTEARFGPTPSIILQALTTKSTSDFFNLERLETIGDSFLKLAVTEYLYKEDPVSYEGILSLKRKRQIENMNLHQLAVKKDLVRFIMNTQFNPRVDWTPPGFVNERQLKIHDKSVADCVEALIGVYLLHCGPDQALKFMNWIGLSVFSDKEIIDPIMNKCTDWERLLEESTDGMDKLEESIGYTFTNRGYLLQALTHASYYHNELTESYQRLEFLGDAVLDYVVTRFIYENRRQFLPGRMTIIRSAIVNNNTLARLAVKLNFHRSLKHYSSELYTMIDEFVMAQTGDKPRGKLDDDDDEKMDKESEVTKVLGDIFESVVGAVYLDCGMSLQTLWGVLYKLMKSEIIKCMYDTPLPPITELMELFPGTLFSPDGEENGQSQFKVTLPDGRSFIGLGRNKNMAKRAAARRALKALKVK